MSTHIIHMSDLYPEQHGQRLRGRFTENDMLVASPDIITITPSNADSSNAPQLTPTNTNTYSFQH